MAGRKSYKQNPNKKNRANLGKDPEITSEFMSRKEAAAFLRMTPGTLSNLHCHEKGPVYYRKGNLSYYLKSDLVEWIMAGKVEPKNRQQDDERDDPESVFFHGRGQDQ